MGLIYRELLCRLSIGLVAVIESGMDCTRAFFYSAGERPRLFFLAPPAAAVLDSEKYYSNISGMSGSSQIMRLFSGSHSSWGYQARSFATKYMISRLFRVRRG